MQRLVVMIQIKLIQFRVSVRCVAAVRFGRVPKREKAKILEQMQRVNVQCQGSLVETIVADEVEISFVFDPRGGVYNTPDYTFDDCHGL